MQDFRTTAAGDTNLLASLEKKLQLVRDHTTAVVKGYKNGLFLYGSGGMGKSFTVLRHLEQLDAPYRLFNGRMTGKGLFISLGHAPDAIHVLEDMERLYTEQTGSSRADFYRRKIEVESGEFDDADDA